MMTDYISKTTVKKMLASDTPLFESAQNKHAVNNLSRLEELQVLLDLGAKVKFVGSLGDTKIPSDVLVEDSYYYRLSTGEWRAKNGHKWYRSKSPKDFLERFVWPSIKVQHITKECVRCWTIKASSEFNKSSSSKDGLQSYCRVCTKEYKANMKKTKAVETNNTEVLPAEKVQAPEVRLSGETLPLEVELATLRERNTHLDEKVQEQKDYIVKLESHLDSLEVPDKPKGFFGRMFK